MFPMTGKPLGEFRKSWAPACKRASVAGGIFHELRSRAVRNIIHARRGQSVAMCITGHRTIGMSLRYGITSEDDKGKALWDAETLTRIDRATRRTFNPSTDVWPAENSPAAKKRNKKTDKIKKGVRPCRTLPLIALVAGEGSESLTFRVMRKVRVMRTMAEQMQF